MKLHLLVVALVAAAVAPVATATPVPDLAGTTVIRAASSARIRVDLPQDATLDLTRRPDPVTGQWSGEFGAVSFDGGGRAVAVAVRRVGAERLALLVARSGLCPTSGCSPHRGGVSHLLYPDFAPPEEWPADPEHPVLPAGRYDVTVVTDGAPLDVTLRLQGLGGVAELSPAVPVDTSQWHLRGTAASPGPAGAAALRDGTSLVIPPGGVIVMAAAGYGTTWLGEHTKCIFAGTGSQLPAAIDSLPACPTIELHRAEGKPVYGTTLLVDEAGTDGRFFTQVDGGLYPSGPYQLRMTAEAAGAFEAISFYALVAEV